MHTFSIYEVSLVAHLHWSNNHDFASTNDVGKRVKSPPAREFTKMEADTYWQQGPCRVGSCSPFMQGGPEPCSGKCHSGTDSFSLNLVTTASFPSPLVSSAISRSFLRICRQHGYVTCHLLLHHVKYEMVYSINVNFPANLQTCKPAHFTAGESNTIQETSHSEALVATMNKHANEQVHTAAEGHTQGWVISSEPRDAKEAPSEPHGVQQEVPSEQETQTPSEQKWHLAVFAVGFQLLALAVERRRCSDCVQQWFAGYQDGNYIQYLLDVAEQVVDEEKREHSASSKATWRTLCHRCRTAIHTCSHVMSVLRYLFVIDVAPHTAHIHISIHISQTPMLRHRQSNLSRSVGSPVMELALRVALQCLLSPCIGMDMRYF